MHDFLHILRIQKLFKIFENNSIHNKKYLESLYYDFLQTKVVKIQKFVISIDLSVQMANQFSSIQQKFDQSQSIIIFNFISRSGQGINSQMESSNHKTKQICKNPNPLKDKKLKKNQSQKQEEDQKSPQIEILNEPRQKPTHQCQYRIFITIFEQVQRNLNRRMEKLLERTPWEGDYLLPETNSQQQEQDQVPQNTQEKTQQKGNNQIKEVQKERIPNRTFQKNQNQPAQMVNQSQEKQKKQEDLFQTPKQMKAEGEQKQQNVEKQPQSKENENENQNQSDQEQIEAQIEEKIQSSQQSSIFYRDQNALENGIQNLVQEEKQILQCRLQRKVLKTIEKARKTLNRSLKFCVQCYMSINTFFERIYRQIIYNTLMMRSQFNDDPIRRKIRIIFKSLAWDIKNQLQKFQQFAEKIDHIHTLRVFRIQSPGSLLFPLQINEDEPERREDEIYDYMFFQNEQERQEQLRKRQERNRPATIPQYGFIIMYPFYPFYPIQHSN